MPSLPSTSSQDSFCTNEIPGEQSTFSTEIYLQDGCWTEEQKDKHSRRVLGSSSRAVLGTHLSLEEEERLADTGHRTSSAQTRSMYAKIQQTRTVGLHPLTGTRALSNSLRLSKITLFPLPNCLIRPQQGLDLSITTGFNDLKHNTELHLQLLFPSD